MSKSIFKDTFKDKNNYIKKEKKYYKEGRHKYFRYYFTFKCAF